MVVAISQQEASDANVLGQIKKRVIAKQAQQQQQQQSAHR